MKCENQMELTFPSQSRNEGFARAAVAAFAAQLDPNLDEIGDIKTAVSEAVTNCIVHAYRDTIGVISLKCRILPGSVLDIIVKDKGCGIGGRDAGAHADVLDRGRRSKWNGLYNHGELHDRAQGHIECWPRNDGTYEAPHHPPGREDVMDAKPQLIERAQQGDKSAAEQLVVENAGLIWSIARRYFGRGVEADDLYQLGALGFLKAIAGFDTRYGTQFSTYAVPKIAGEIRRFLRDDGAVKVSRSVKERAGTIKKERQRLMGELGREPTLSELSDALGIPPEEIASAEMATGSAESIQRQTGEEGITLEDVLAGPEMEEGILERMALKQALSNLSEREQMVISLRYFHGLTQQKVASMIGVSQVQVSRIEKKALERLRAFL